MTHTWPHCLVQWYPGEPSLHIRLHCKTFTSGIFWEAVLKARATWQPPCYHEGWKPGGECTFWEKQSCKKEWENSWWHYLTHMSCQNSRLSEVISWDICFPGNKVKDTDFLLFCDSMFKSTYFQIRYLTIIYVPLWTNVNPFRKKLI